MIINIITKNIFVIIMNYFVVITTAFTNTILHSTCIFSVRQIKPTLPNIHINVLPTFLRYQFDKSSTFYLFLFARGIG